MIAEKRKLSTSFQACHACSAGKGKLFMAFQDCHACSAGVCHWGRDRASEAQED